ncbi:MULTISPECIES: hypothetical protein [unclassified Plantibacter]|uniref:hypothetical protein n=1 Tax=unclassified Plantibacter TaxID=2624265 RepID=UPI0017836E5E|nr:MULTISPECIES: hypothetical protein [unclassified Plantibacter]MBD8101274.1 hypothetical protein [Plantibacter sp. CFBP 8775]MBD8518520.1 hypothetical protein [Plantibacter sp. CFBP 8804]
MFVRFQSAVPNRNGRFPGVFAMANGLHDTGRLSGKDAAWWRQSNDRLNAAYANPSLVSPGSYEHPGARSWFRETAIDLLTLTGGYLALLDRYDIPWGELRTMTPGRLTYEDDVQIVAVPFRYPDDWPL